MAETVTNKSVCEACGADVRPGSVFCYNCGGPVAEDAPDAPKSNRVSSAWFQGDIGEQKFETNRLEAPDEPIVKPTSDLNEKPAAKKKEKKAKGVKTAAAESATPSGTPMRRKAKTFQARNVGIVWEEPSGTPNLLFPLVSLALLIVVGVIVFFAFYLR